MRVSNFFALAARGQLLILLLFPLFSPAQIVKEVKFPYQADIIACEVLYEYQADVLIYVTDKKYELRDDNCFWLFTKNSYEADFTMYFTSYQYQADLKVYYVDQKYKARWKNKKKENLLK